MSFLERVSCPIAISPAQRRKSSAPSRVRLDRLLDPLLDSLLDPLLDPLARASRNFCARNYADCPRGDVVVVSATSFLSFWPAIIVPRRISAIGITGREARFSRRRQRA
jgi:hypothetical protein